MMSEQQFQAEVMDELKQKETKMDIKCTTKKQDKTIREKCFLITQEKFKDLFDESKNKNESNIKYVSKKILSAFVDVKKCINEEVKKYGCRYSSVDCDDVVLSSIALSMDYCTDYSEILDFTYESTIAGGVLAAICKVMIMLTAMSEIESFEDGMFCGYEANTVLNYINTHGE